MKLSDDVRDAVLAAACELDGEMGLHEQVAAFDAHRFSADTTTNQPTLHLDDVSAIPFLDGIVGMEFYQLRARVRAGDGDLFAATCPAVPGYETYNRNLLGLGSPSFLHAEPTEVPSAVARACARGETFDALVARARQGGRLCIHPYMGSEPVWSLARSVAQQSGAEVTVLAPPPPVTWLANDKERLTRVADMVAGDGVLRSSPTAETLSSSEPTQIAANLREVARRHERVALKMLRCASAMGNEVCVAQEVLQEEPSATEDRVRRFLEEKEWNPGDEVLAVAWIDAVASPSTQLWIPPLGAGDPRVDGVYEQLLEGEECVFLGAVPSTLGEDWDRRLSEASLRIALLYQQVGYVGRCSFDFVLAEDGARVVECNGRWGGTSTPMHLVDRLFPAGRPAYRARDVIDPALSGVPFPEVLGALEGELYDHRSGAGRFVLYNVGCLGGYGKLDVISIAETMEDAEVGLEEILPERLSALTS